MLRHWLEPSPNALSPRNAEPARVESLARIPSSCSWLEPLGGEKKKTSLPSIYPTQPLEVLLSDHLFAQLLKHNFNAFAREQWVQRLTGRARLIDLPKGKMGGYM